MLNLKLLGNFQAEIIIFPEATEMKNEVTYKN